MRAKILSRNQSNNMIHTAMIQCSSQEELMIAIHKLFSKPDSRVPIEIKFLDLPEVITVKKG